jgi:hypothetical protein
MVAVTMLTAAFTDQATPQRMLVMAIGVALAVALPTDWRHGLLLAVTGYLLYVGFLVNRFGELTWHGRDIRWELAGFALAALIGRLGRVGVKAPSRMGERSPTPTFRRPGSRVSVGSRPTGSKR